MRIDDPTPVQPAAAVCIRLGNKDRLLQILLAGIVCAAIPNPLRADEQQPVKLAPFVYQSPDCFEVNPDGTLPRPQEPGAAGAKSLAGPIAPSAGRARGGAQGQSCVPACRPWLDLWRFRLRHLGLLVHAAVTGAGDDGRRRQPGSNDPVGILLFQCRGHGGAHATDWSSDQ